MQVLINDFPDFSEVTLEYRQEIEAITQQFEPYSDFNFVSLFTWNTDGSATISKLNDNLVIRLPHYTKGHSIYSMLGINRIDESASRLLELTGRLEMVPEIVRDAIVSLENFTISEDRDNFDFVYHVEGHAKLGGKEFREKRKKYNRFLNTFGEIIRVEEVDLKDGSVQSQVIDIFQRWAQSKETLGADNELELTAIKRLLEYGSHFKLVCLLLSIDSVPAGFTIHEILNQNYAICHYHKTLTSYANSDVYLTSVAAQDLLQRGCHYVNWEQDLGIKGLRQSKLSYSHVRFLKKYIIEPAAKK